MGNGPDGKVRHAQLFQAALPVVDGEPLPERVGPAQQYVVDHAQRVGPGAQRAAHRRAVRQRQAVRLGGDQRRRPGHERRERHGGAAPRPEAAAQLADCRVEADVRFPAAVVPLERLLGRERAGPEDVPAGGRRQKKNHQTNPAGGGGRRSTRGRRRICCARVSRPCPSNRSGPGETCVVYVLIRRTRPKIGRVFFGQLPPEIGEKIRPNEMVRLRRNSGKSIRNQTCLLHSQYFVRFSRSTFEQHGSR